MQGSLITSRGVKLTSFIKNRNVYNYNLTPKDNGTLLKIALTKEEKNTTTFNRMCKYFSGELSRKGVGRERGGTISLPKTFLSEIDSLRNSITEFDCLTRACIMR